MIEELHNRGELLVIMHAEQSAVFLLHLDKIFQSCYDSKLLVVCQPLSVRCFLPPLMDFFFSRTSSTLFPPVYITPAWLRTFRPKGYHQDCILMGQVGYNTSLFYLSSLTATKQTSKAAGQLKQSVTKSLHVIWWILFLLLLTSSASTCLQHSPNHVHRLFLDSVQEEMLTQCNPSVGRLGSHLSQYWSTNVEWMYECHWHGLLFY